MWKCPHEKPRIERETSRVKVGEMGEGGCWCRGIECRNFTREMPCEKQMLGTVARRHLRALFLVFCSEISTKGWWGSKVERRHNQRPTPTERIPFWYRMSKHMLAAVFMETETGNNYKTKRETKFGRCKKCLHSLDFSIVVPLQNGTFLSFLMQVLKYQHTQHKLEVHSSRSLCHLAAYWDRCRNNQLNKCLFSSCIAGHAFETAYPLLSPSLFLMNNNNENKKQQISQHLEATLSALPETFLAYATQWAAHTCIHKW